MDWHLEYQQLAHRDRQLPPRARFDPTKWAAEYDLEGPLAATVCYVVEAEPPPPPPPK